MVEIDITTRRKSIEAELATEQDAFNAATRRAQATAGRIVQLRSQLDLLEELERPPITPNGQRAPKRGTVRKK